MKARYVAGRGLEGLLDPESSVWRGVRAERVRMIGTPSGMQPTAAIRAAWPDTRIGAIDRVALDVAHDGQHLAFRLEWADDTEDAALGDTVSFPDAAAVLLPAAKDAPLITMGAPGLPVNAWYWRADENGTGRQVVAEGIGTTRTVDRELVRGQGTWKDGRWRVVIARALRVQGAEAVAQLRPGELTGLGVAVWEGSRGERAGIKSFSGDWMKLQLEALPQARR
jgi:DMSO reductase family type II enzyme heme b subunit